MEKNTKNNLKCRLCNLNQNFLIQNQLHDVLTSVNNEGITLQDMISSTIDVKVNNNFFYIEIKINPTFSDIKEG